MIDPIFIHSLFRAGSTHLFNVFRTSDTRYRCFQEPLHELAVFARDDPNLLLIDHGEDKIRLLRHPRISENYFQELHDTWPDWKDALSPPAVYDSYFAPPNADIGIDYWRKLAEVAKGRPVFQECRTSGRIGAIKEQLGGYHIYLWRNPWDQWWSYKVAPYFDVANQIIINAPNSPPAVNWLRKAIGFELYAQKNIGDTFDHFGEKPITSDESYLIFYTLWCLGLQEGMKHAHLMLNIDRLSEAPAYRETIQTQLEEAGITGIDFSNCLVPRARYLKRDRDFFIALEDNVHGWLKDGGWSQKYLNTILTLRQQFEPASWHHASETLNQNDLAEQATRARSLVRRFETEAALSSREGAKRETHVEARRILAEATTQKAEVRAEQAEARTEQAEIRAEQAEARAEQAKATAEEAEARAEQAEARAEQAEASARESHTTAQQAEAYLTAIYSSRSWRITAPVRRARNAASWFVRGTIAWLTFKPGCRPRRILRSALVSLRYTMSSRPRLKVIVARILSFFPQLDARLRLIVTPHSHLIERAIISSPTEDSFQGADDLSPMAREIYFDLKAAIEQRQKEQR